VETRSLGVEEELLVVDPHTWSATSRAREVLKSHAEHQHRDRVTGSAHDDLDHELFRHQLETRTDPPRDLDDLLDLVLAARRTAAAAATSRGLAIAACAAIPLGVDEPRVTSDDRYLAMAETFAEVAQFGTTCGMHVHVAIESEDEGVGCLDRIAPWLPVLLAMSVNSPFSAGRDTGYASWRTQMWSTWPSAGPSEAFGSVAGYHRACDRMIASGAARDPAMLYWDARLSVAHPTLEVRVLDVLTDPEDAVVLAALVRGLVETASRDWASGAELRPWRCEELRAARWRAARYGLAGELLDPTTHELRSAADVVHALRDLVADRLEAADDTDRVDAGLRRVLAATGAARQRAAYERTGTVEGVVADLVARTAACWDRSEAGRARPLGTGARPDPPPRPSGADT
jgi:carboxylate-amine ligase